MRNPRGLSADQVGGGDLASLAAINAARYSCRLVLPPGHPLLPMSEWLEVLFESAVLIPNVALLVIGASSKGSDICSLTRELIKIL